MSRQSGNWQTFAAKWNASHQSIAKSWWNNWERIIPLFSYPEDIRKAIYENAEKQSYDELKKFHTENMANKPYTYCIVASEKKLDAEEVKKCGEVKKLSLREIFGY